MKKMVATVLALGMMLGITQGIYAEDVPRPLAVLYPEIVDIVAGGYHSIALNRGGDVFTFGSNRYGELGLGYASDEGIVYDISVDDAGYASQASSRSDHILAVQNKKAYAWGRNDQGQLGTGDRAEKTSMTPVQGLDGLDIVAVAAGHQFSLALDAEGDVYAWGHNGYGQLGNGSDAAQQITPVKVDISGVEQISAGHYHALVKKKDGTIWGWGRNLNGALGVGDAESYSAPVQIPLSDIKEVVAGYNTSFFLKNSGTVYACGDNSDGKLGDGTRDNRATPVRIEGLSNVCQISSNTCTIFLKTDGTAYGTGNNNYGQLGLGENIGRVLSPTKIPGDGYTKVSTGGGHTLLYWGQPYNGGLYGGKIYAMGRNQYYQCGSKNEENIYYPTEVSHIQEIDDRETFIPLEDIQPGVNRVLLPPIENTYVSQHGDDNTKNFSKSGLCGINYTRSENGTGGWGQYTYLKFNTADIPKEKMISAKLWVYVDAKNSDKRNSTRTVGIYDTQTTDWNASTMTWADGRAKEGQNLLGTFQVTGNGSIIEDAGWKSVDITNYIASGQQDIIGLMAKMTTETAHPVNICSSYGYARLAPQLVVEYADNVSYEWKRTSPGGGGAAFAPQINPYDTDMIMMSCDMTGNYFSYDGGQSFSMYPTPYRVTSIHAASADDIYMAGNAVLKSTDKGQTFTQVYPEPNEFGFSYRGLTSTPFYNIPTWGRTYSYTSVVTPMNCPDDVFFISYYGGKSRLFYSNDGGNNFDEIYDTNVSSSLNKVYAYQTEQGICAYMFHAQGVTQVNVIKDGQNGTYSVETQPVYSGAITNGTTNGQSVYVVKAVDPADSSYDESTDRYFKSILYKLEPDGNGGMEAVKISTNLTELMDLSGGEEIRAVTQVEAAEDGTVMVGYGGNLINEGVAITTDDGQNWAVYKERPGNDKLIVENNGYIQDRGYYGEQPTGVYVLDSNTFLFTTIFGAYMTNNGGQLWRQLENHPFDSNGNPDNGISGNGGVDKFLKSTGLDFTSITSVLVDPKYPDRIMLNMMDVGGFISYDAGETWKQCNYVKEEDVGEKRKYDMLSQLKWDSYGSIYIPSRDLMMTIWTSVNDLPKQNLGKYKEKDTEGVVIRGCISVSKNGGYSQIALNAIRRDGDKSIPVAIKCFQKGITGDYSIYVCYFGHGIYRFDLTEEMLATQTDEELIESFNIPSNWHSMNAGLENSAVDTKPVEPQVLEGSDGNPQQNVWCYESPLLRFYDEDNFSVLNTLEEPDTAAAISDSDIIQIGDNIYTYDLVEDNDHNLYTVISNVVGYPLTRGEINNQKYGNKGGIYKLVEDASGEMVWNQIPLPNGAEVPNTIAFDSDNAMYAGFYTTKPSNQVLPYSWKYGGVYKTTNDGGSWEQIVEDTKSINHLLYDKQSQTLYIAGNAIGLLSYQNGEVSKVEGYDFSSANRVFIGNGKLYACSRGAGLFIRSAVLD